MSRVGISRSSHSSVLSREKYDHLFGTASPNVCPFFYRVAYLSHKRPSSFTETPPGYPLASVSSLRRLPPYPFPLCALSTGNYPFSLLTPAFDLYGPTSRPNSLLHTCVPSAFTQQTSGFTPRHRLTSLPLSRSTTPLRPSQRAADFGKQTISRMTPSRPHQSARVRHSTTNLFLEYMKGLPLEILSSKILLQHSPRRVSACTDLFP